MIEAAVTSAIAELKTLFFWALGGVASILGGTMAWIFNDMNRRINGKADEPELTRVRDDSAELWRSHARMGEQVNERHREQMHAIGEVAEAVARIEGKISK